MWTDRERTPMTRAGAGDVHAPHVFFSAAGLGVAVVVSGHTHGGQVRLPGLPVLVRMSRYRLDEGRFRFRDADLVVSRGIGASGIPLRIACSPEVVRLVFRAGESSQRKTGTGAARA